MSASLIYALLALATSIDGAQLRHHAESLPSDSLQELQSETLKPLAPKPHILFILVDDLGWADVGWNRAEKTSEIVTPHMDQLAHEGIILDRHYVHHFCSPTRSAIQSGRAPINVNVLNVALSSVNPLDPVSGFAGIPRKMTGMAEVLRNAGYSTHMVGKWDVGMATPEHTPAGRGYDTSLVYFHHVNNCWKFDVGKCHLGKDHSKIQDVWNMNGDITFPGWPLVEAASNLENNCSFESQHPTGGTCVYEDQLFEDRVTSTIRNHNTSKPLFIFWATRGVHLQHEPPEEEIAQFSFIEEGCECDERRKKYHSMIGWIDRAIGRVVDTLEEKDMYRNTLIVLSSDNGGALPATSAGNNYPLKGGKYANWDGGIRVAAFVSGGFVPEDVRGSVQTNLLTGWDWYATFAAIAGVDPTDTKAAKAGLPPIDSINQWPMLSGVNATPPRRRVELGSTAGGDADRENGSTQTLVGGLIVPPYKILIGDNITRAAWPGPRSLNSTTNGFDFEAMVEDCGRTPKTGCLYDIFADPGEHVNLANDKPDIFKDMLAQVEALSLHVFSPNRGEADRDAACRAALYRYGGFWGPFLS